MQRILATSVFALLPAPPFGSAQQRRAIVRGALGPGVARTFQAPEPWLKAGTNELVIFDILPTAHESVSGQDHPVFDARVANAKRSQQE
jgi:hypothetical protein